jgi:predicted Zn-dependent protease
VSERDPALGGLSRHGLHEQIERLLSVRKLDHAANVLRQAFTDAPGDPDNNYYAARIAYERRNYADAAGELERVLGIDPSHEPARLLFVSVAIEQKRYTAAEQVLLELIRLRPENGELYAKYAWLMLLTLHVDKARELTREALRLSPEGTLPQTLDLLVSLIDGREQRAGERLRELVSQDPESLHAAWLLVLVLSDQHRYEEACAIGQEILKAAPDDPDIVDTVIRLKAASHWLAKPNWPAVRYGFAGAAVTWGLAVFTLQVLRRIEPVWAGVFGVVWLAYVIYSWVHQPLLYRWLRHRGF